MNIDPHDPAVMGHLTRLAQNATSANGADRETAERDIKEYQNHVDQQSGFVLLLLNMATTYGPAASFCSIVFKNTVKMCWSEKQAEHCIMEADKSVVRSNITTLMLHANANVQKNLAEAIAMIAANDFPKKWPNALDRLIDVMQNEDSVTVQSAALSMAHSILGRYRDQGDFSEEFVHDLRIIYTALTAPLLCSMQKMIGVMEKNGEEVKMAIEGLVSAVECLRDLTSLDLGDEFIWNMESFVGVFLRCLQFCSSRNLQNCLIDLKSTVMSCVAHFLISFDEDFEKYAGSFLKVVWDTISSPESMDTAMDDVVIQGINLLSAAASSGTSSAVFKDPAVLQNLVEHVIMPNLSLRPDDLELYKEEPDTYIQRDIEDSDFHTRRREAGDLVRAVMMAFSETTTRILVTQLQQLMAASTGGDWKAKDLSIYLVSALALQGQHASSQRGATQHLNQVVSFESFLKEGILSELSTNVSASSPYVIKADCIRFLATFRTHIDPQILPHIIELLTSWILCPDTVVHTYAAHAVERIFTVQLPDQHGSVITESSIGSKIPLLLQNLCTRLQNDETPNAYTMQCLLRACQSCRNSVTSFVGDIITCLVPVLTVNAKNPSNPLFNFYMFEVISRCIQMRPEDGAAIEGALWGPLIYILHHDVLDYVPYTLQILAQLLDTHGSATLEPPEHYRSLLEPLLLPDVYGQQGNIPAVVRLLVAFIEHYPRYIHSKGLTEKVLAVFRTLLQYKNYDHEGLNILTAVIIAYPKEVIDPMMGSVYQLLFQRLQHSKTPKYVRLLIIFFSIAVVVYGADSVVAKVNSIQGGLFWMLFQSVWQPNVQKVTGVLERKVCVVALANLLGESAVLQQNETAWAECVFRCLKIIHCDAEADDVTSFTPSSPGVAELKQASGDSGFTNVFCPLQAAVHPPIDVCSAIHEPDMYFRQHIQQVLRGPNGAHFAGLLQNKLSPSLLALIQ